MKPIDLVSCSAKGVAGIKDEARESGNYNATAEQFAALMGDVFAQAFPGFLPQPCGGGLEEAAVPSDPASPGMTVPAPAQGTAAPLGSTQAAAFVGMASNALPSSNPESAILPGAKGFEPPGPSKDQKTESGEAAIAKSMGCVPEEAPGKIAVPAAQVSPAILPVSNPSGDSPEILPAAGEDLDATPPPSDSTHQPNAPPESGAFQKLWRSKEARPVMPPGIAAANNAPPAGGTCGAKQYLPMQLAAKTEENAETAEKKLPASPAVSAREDLPTQAFHAARMDSSPPPQFAVSAATPATFATASPSMELLRTIERTEDLMALHGMRLRDSGNESLEVMIKPGNGIQLSLTLRMEDGRVEMHARLQGGDYEFLSRHWSELQQQLEPRGVRLTTLTAGDQGAGGFTQSKQQDSRDPAGYKGCAHGAIAEFALSGGLIKKPGLHPKSRRGWESWA